MAVKWDGLLACDKGPLKVLVLLEARESVRKQDVDHMALHIAKTSAFLQTMIDGNGPAPGSDRKYQQSFRYLKVGFVGRHVIEQLALHALCLKFVTACSPRGTCASAWKIGSMTFLVLRVSWAPSACRSDVLG